VVFAAGAALIAVAVVAWWAGGRWRLARAAFLFAAAAMGGRLALKGAGVELVDYGDDAFVFRMIAGVLGFLCLFAGIRVLAMWLRFGDAKKS
jgi:hypothetical protein